MKCPSCGVMMNFHAEKVDYSMTLKESDNSLDGLIQEFHTCPECGRSGSRPGEEHP
jgi:ribosomal protein S27AE